MQERLCHIIIIGPSVAGIMIGPSVALLELQHLASLPSCKPSCQARWAVPIIPLIVCKHDVQPKRQDSGSMHGLCHNLLFGPCCWAGPCAASCASGMAS
eukprot:3624451-Rhodomonas_salina.1